MEKTRPMYRLPVLESSISPAYGGGSASIWDTDASFFREYSVGCIPSFGTKQEALAFARELRRHGQYKPLVAGPHPFVFIEELPESERTYAALRRRRLRG